MNSFSALLPVWIIGAPLAYIVFDWMRMPKTAGHARAYENVQRPVPGAAT